ncbi:hypothetical protein EDB19DRAFT_1826460 [Suillus lakei]|nr:hypothetical protein EDB19DRAFT_1826460 [Suillus lakei]
MSGWIHVQVLISGFDQKALILSKIRPDTSTPIPKGPPIARHHLQVFTVRTVVPDLTAAARPSRRTSAICRETQPREVWSEGTLAAVKLNSTRFTGVRTGVRRSPPSSVYIRCMLPDKSLITLLLLRSCGCSEGNATMSGYKSERQDDVKSFASENRWGQRGANDRITGLSSAVVPPSRGRRRSFGRHGRVRYDRRSTTFAGMWDPMLCG